MTNTTAITLSLDFARLNGLDHASHNARGYHDLTHYPHALADDRKVGWIGAILASLAINIAFVAAYAAKIASFVAAAAGEGRL